MGEVTREELAAMTDQELMKKAPHNFSETASDLLLPGRADRI